MQKIGNKKFNKTGFHHIALKVKDFDRSLALYSEVLGFSKALAWGTPGKRACMLDMGDGTYIELFEGGTASGSLQSEPMIHFAILTEQCDAMYQAALSAGCSSHMVPTDLVIHGESKELPVRISFVVGYDGELVEFFQCAE